jgi:hypothetical protein
MSSEVVERPMVQSAREQLRTLLPKTGLGDILGTRLDEGCLMLLVPGRVQDEGSSPDLRAGGRSSWEDERRHVLALWETAASMAASAILITQNEAFRPASTPEAEPTMGVLNHRTDYIVLPLALFRASGALNPEIAEWVDPIGPTFLLTKPWAGLLTAGGPQLRARDLPEIFAQVVEAYIPVFDGESFVVWRRYAP